MYASPERVMLCPNVVWWALLGDPDCETAVLVWSQHRSLFVPIVTREWLAEIDEVLESRDRLREKKGVLDAIFEMARFDLTGVRTPSRDMLRRCEELIVGDRGSVELLAMAAANNVRYLVVNDKEHPRSSLKMLPHREHIKTELGVEVVTVKEFLALLH